jgi:amidase
LQDATETSRQIHSGEVSAREVVEAAVRRAEALQPTLNFLAAEDFQRAIETADRIDAAGPATMGPFAGVPFLVKDLKDVPGLPTRSGSRSRRDEPPATEPDPYIDAFVQSGMVVIGKSTTPEFGFLPTSEALLNGPTRNPWNPEHSAGGSSGGASAAVAAGVVEVAHASDGGGSIRIPAVNCGLFGLKPSRGRLIRPKGPKRAIEISVQHVLTRSVRDSAALLALTEARGQDAAFTLIGNVGEASSRRLRIGLAQGGPLPDPDVGEAVVAAAELLTDLGHAVVDAPWPFGPAFLDDFMHYWSLGAAGEVEAFTARTGRAPSDTDMEPFSLAMADLAQGFGASERDALIERLQEATRNYTAWIATWDVVLSPVVQSAPPRIGWFRGDNPYETMMDRLRDYVGYTPIHNIAGAPAMSVPLHWNAAGLPIGVQFSAAAGQEQTLLELAYELEAALPWAGRLPPIYAA